MPRNPRDYKKEAAERRADPKRQAADNERTKARYRLDKMGVDRKGKDVSHVKALASGGSNADGVFLSDRHANRAFKKNAKSRPSNPIDKPRGRVLKPKL